MKNTGDCVCFDSLLLAIGLKISRHFVSQSEKHIYAGFCFFCTLATCTCLEFWLVLLCSLWLARVILWFWFYYIQYRVIWPQVLESFMFSFYQASWCNSYLNPSVVWKLKGHTKWVLVALIKCRCCAGVPLKSTLLSLLGKITCWGTRSCQQFDSSSLTSSGVNFDWFISYIQLC